MATPMSLNFRGLKPGFNHKDADTRVIEEIATFCAPGIPESFLCVNIIRAIAEDCPEFMLAKPELMKVWDKLESELTPYVMEAWKTQSFERLRSIVELQKPGTSELSDEANTLINWQREATQNSWRTPYQGDAHVVLRDVIKTIEFGPTEKRRGQTDAYANTMSIIQSSGTGKSRMVDKLAEIEFVFPFNLRERKAMTSFAYPDPDHEVRDYFLTTNEGTDKRNIGMYYCTFLISLFERASEILDKCPPNHRYSVASWWCDYLEQSRPSLYRNVIAHSHDIHSALSTQARKESEMAAPRFKERFETVSEPPKSDSDRMDAFTALEIGADAATTNPETASRSSNTKTGSAGEHRGTAKATEETMARKEAVASTHERLGLQRVTETCSALLTKVQTISGRVDALIVLYFDEAHVLHEALDPSQTTVPRHTRYTTLLWALDSLANTAGVFSLFLSTNSHLGKFAPTPSFVPSARLSTSAHHLQAPYTELPFDCFPEWPILSGSFDLAKSSEISFLCQFGRPLFWSRYLSGERIVHEVIVDFAKTKLAPDVTGENATDSQLAALDARLLLNFERSETALNKQADLVEGRMRIAYSVPEHRRYMYSGYPSEPILAEASAKCWAELSAANMSIPGLLSRFVDNGYIDKGERGELVARLLLLLAYDAAVRDYSGHASQNAQDRRYTCSVPLELFLQKLFGRTHASAILRSYANVGTTPLGKAFEKAHVRFTHFIRAGDTSIVSTSGAYASILRSSGIQCSSGQEAIDIVVPIVLGDESTRLEESVMTSILISVKNRARASSVAETGVNATDLGFFPSAQTLHDGTEYGRPYIALVLELGVQPRESGASDDVVNSKGKNSISDEKGKKSSASVSEGPKTPSQLTSQTEPTTGGPPCGATTLKNPQYMIRVHGCSPTVYDVVADKNQFAVLLGLRNLRDEHARNSAASHQAVMRLKPFWKVGEDCYHWLCDVLDRPPVQGSDEGVFVNEEVTNR